MAYTIVSRPTSEPAEESEKPHFTVDSRPEAEKSWGETIADMVKAAGPVGDRERPAGVGGIDPAIGANRIAAGEQERFHKAELAKGPALGTVDTAKAIGSQIVDAAMVHLPAAFAANLEGSDAFSKRDWKDRAIEKSRETAKKASSTDGKAHNTVIPGLDTNDIASLGPSLGFSAVGLGAGIAGAVPGAVAGSVAGPEGAAVGGYLSGGTAAGAAGYRMATNQFVRDLREAIDADRAKTPNKGPISDEEFQKKADQLAPIIREYGLWEAVPEALGSVTEFSILKAPVKSALGKIFGEGITQRLIKKAAGLYGTELATEGVTQQGQNNAEVDAGLTEGPRRSWVSAEDLGKSFAEVAPSVILQTTLLGGTTHAAIRLQEHIKQGGLTPDQYDVLMAMNDAVNRGQVDPEEVRQEAVRRLDPNSADAIRQAAQPTHPGIMPPPEGGMTQPSESVPAPAAPGPLTAAMLYGAQKTIESKVAQIEAEEAQAPAPAELTGVNDAPDNTVPQTAMKELPAPQFTDTFPEDALTSSDATSNYKVVARPGEATGQRHDPVIIEPGNAKDISLARNQVKAPTEAQVEAGNYQKGHVKVQGLAVTIENPVGSERSGVDPDGKPWSVKMPADYGYIKRTVGADDEQVDVYLGHEPHAHDAYVIDQVDADTGKFDEHKIVLGVPSEDAARQLYHAGFSDGRGHERLGSITHFTMPALKHWLAEGNTKSPASEYEVESHDDRIQREADRLEELADQYDFEKAYPQPDESILAALESEGRTHPFLEGGDRHEQVKFVTDELLNELTDGARGTLILKDAEKRKLDPRTGKPVAAGKEQDVANYIKAARARIAAQREDLIASYADIFGEDAAHITLAEADRRALEAPRRARSAGDFIEKDEPQKSSANSAAATVKIEADRLKLDLTDTELSDAAALVASGADVEDALSQIIERAAIIYEAELAADAAQEGLGNEWTTPFDEGGDVEIVPQTQSEGGAPAENVASEEDGSQAAINQSGADQGSSKKGSRDPEVKPLQDQNIDTPHGVVRVTMERWRGPSDGASWPEVKNGEAFVSFGLHGPVSETGYQSVAGVRLKDTSEEVLHSLAHELAEDYANKYAAVAAKRPKKKAKQPKSKSPELASATPVAPDTSYGANNALVTRDRAEELRARLKEKLKNQLNAGIDPEIMAIGAELTAFHVEAGARKFVDFAKAIVDDLGTTIEKLRPYLRSWYNGARDMMEDAGLDISGMDDAAEVKAAFATLDSGAENGLQNALSEGDAGASPRDVQGVEPLQLTPESRPRKKRGSPSNAGRNAATEPDDGTGTGSRGNSDGNPDRLPLENLAATANVSGENFRIEPGTLNEERGWKTKARDNIRALELARSIEAAGRPATFAEQQQLARYVGWGGIKGAFPDASGAYGKGYEEIGAKLKSLLSSGEYATAERSIQYAHYTAEAIVRAMWAAAKQFGFNGGSVFEPGMGVGNFAGMMPADIAARTTYQGLEMDHTSARIAQLLYPKWGVRREDFTKAPLPHNTFDLVIGNPPFGDITISSDPAYAKHKFLLHDYFFAKSMDSVRPGGLLMFVTSAGTMNKISNTARTYLAAQADLVGAVRLPSNAFRKNAGTDVTTDIIVLRKKLENGQNGPAFTPIPEKGWLDVGTIRAPDADGQITTGHSNTYFIDHPDMVLGEEGFFDKLYKGRYAVHAREGFDLERELAAAFAKMPSNILASWQDTTDRANYDFGTKETKEGSYYIGADDKLMQLVNGVGTPVQQRGKGVTGGKTAAEIALIRQLIPIRDALRDVYAADLAEDTKKAAKARIRLNESYDAFVKKNGPINKGVFQERRPTAIQAEVARAKAREEARYVGEDFDEGSFDPTDMIKNRRSWAEIAKAREAVRARLGDRYSDGTFVVADMPDNIIEQRPNIAPMAEDPENYRLRSIEQYNDATGEASKRGVFSHNVITQEKTPEINSVGDALLHVLNKLGRVDIPAIAVAAGKTESQVIDELGEGLYRVPGTEANWVTADEYLSGDVRKKLDIALAAAERDPSLRRNVAALEAVLPPPLTPSDIKASLGMPWIPASDIEAFGREALGLSRLSVENIPKMGLWIVRGDQTSAAATSEWGTARMTAPELIAAALNHTGTVIRDTNPDKSTSKNINETEAAEAKLVAIKERFSEWIWEDEARADRLTEHYNRNYNGIVKRAWNGNYLTTPGIAAGWSWRPHQTRVMARIIQSGNTYLAHAVGAGKTSEMIGAGMEMRRLGLVRKPMYAVPNHMLGQFTKEFYEQYPTARIKVADDHAFHTDRRKQFIADVASSDLDAVIITHSAFGLIPVSADFQDSLIQEELDQYRELLEAEKGDRITRSRLQKQIERLENRLQGNSKKQDAVFTFEEMGVDFLFVDEAHEFRKLDFATKMSNIKGVSPDGSKMAWDLYVKTRYLEQKSPGRNLVLASGTPITNTMAELYTISRYMQPRELEARQITHFDAWASAYGDTVTSLEQNAAGGYQDVTRFAQFANVPELSAMVSQFMDVVTSNELGKYVARPTLIGGKRIMHVANRSTALEAYQEHLARRMAAINARKGKSKPGDDILLSVINDGRHAAIDMRLVAPSIISDEPSKLDELVDEAYKNWLNKKNHPFYRPLGTGYEAEPFEYGPATQMIFANLGLGASREFNVNSYIVAQLVARGVPRAEIELIADHKTAVARQRVFNDMNVGKVRILIGSTKRMATGVNAQRRLADIHNLDPLWFPAEDEQRNGRGIRQGNTNREIAIHDYSTKGTYDSTMWGLMETKARFIEGFFRGDPTLRHMEDLGEASTYEQAKALSTNDPRLIELTEKRQKLEKLNRAKGAFKSRVDMARRRIIDARASVARAEKRLPFLTADINQIEPTKGDLFKGTVGQTAFKDRAEFGEALQRAYEDLKKSGKPQKRVLLGTVGGFEIYAHTYKQSADDLFLSGGMFLQRNGGYETEVGISSSPVGQARKIENAIEEFATDISYFEHLKSTGLKDIHDFSKVMDEKFTGQAEIDNLSDEVDRLESEIKASEVASPDQVATASDADKDTPESKAKAAAAEQIERLYDEARKKKESDLAGQDADGEKFSIAADGEDEPLVNKEPVVRLTGHELGVAFTGPEDLPALRRAAQRWYDTHLRTTTVTMRDGTTVRFNQRGRNKSAYGGKGDILLRAVPAIRHILERGVVVAQEPGNRDYVIERRIVAAPVELDGKVLFLAVSIHKTADGHFHYDFTFNREGEASGPGIGARLALGLAPADSRDGTTASLINLFEWDESFKEASEKASTLRNLQARLSDVGLSDRVRLKFSQDIQALAGGKSSGIRGRYTRGLIEIALRAKNKAWTLDHEIIHALKDYGLFTPPEWRTLSRAARLDQKRMEDVRTRYAQRNLTDEEVIEEVIADMFADWANANVARPSLLEAVFQKIRGFFQAIHRALTGASISSADQIFGAVDRGDIGSRTVGQKSDAQPVVNKYSFERETPSATALDNYIEQLSPELDSYARPIVADYVRYMAPADRAGLSALIESSNGDADKLTALADALGVTLRGKATPSNLSKAVKDSYRRMQRAIAGMAEMRSQEAIEANMLKGLIPEPREPARKPRARVAQAADISAVDRLLKRAPKLPDPGDFTALQRGFLHPYQIATLDPEFADVFHWGMEFGRLRNEAQVMLGQVIEPYMTLSEAERENINKVLEIGRLEGLDYSENQTISVTNAGHRHAILPVGKTVTLTPEERNGYLAVRGMFDRALLMFKQQVLVEAGLGKPGDPRTPEGIRLFAQDQSEELTGYEREALERAADMVDVIEKARRVGYVPFSRYGDYSISVTNNEGEVGWFQKIERGLGDREKVAKARAALMQRFPRKAGFIVQQVRYSPKTDISGIQDIDFAALDEMAKRGGADAETVDAYNQAVQAEWTRQGFRSHFVESRNTPGYEHDFTRTISDYIVGISGYLARRNAMGPMEQAVGRINLQKPALRQYAKNYKNYIFNPQEEFGGWRQLMFYAYLAGNVSSAAINLTQVPLFSLPFLSMATSAARATMSLTNAARITASMFSPRLKADFLNFDISKAPDDVRADLEALMAEGTLVPSVTLENMGIAAGRKKFLRGLGNTSRQVMEISGTMFTSAERFNRIATAIAALRIARHDPKAMANATKAFANSNVWRDMALNGQHQPIDFARFVINETHFLQGKANRPLALRGIWSVVGQFKGFTMNALQCQWRMAKLYGPAGKKAFAINLALLYLGGGLLGLPGADDLKDWLEWLHRFVRRYDIDIEKEMQELAVDIFGDKTGPTMGEVIRRGLLRQSGVDISQRIGMGAILPVSPPAPSYSALTNLEKQLEIFGLPGSVIASAMRAADSFMAGDAASGFAELSRYVISAGGANAAKAVAMASDGLRSRTGSMIMNPDDLSTSDIALRALGFQSTRIARRRETEWMETRAANAVAELQSSYYSKVARAEAAGDMATAEALYEEIDDWNAKMPDYLQINLSPTTLKKRIEQELEGKSGVSQSSLPKKARAESETIRGLMPAN